MPDDELRLAVEKLADTLHLHGEAALAGSVRAVLEGSDEGLETFLTSNALWGGPGSIADQAGIAAGRSEDRRAIERALVDVGEAQIRCGIVNVRTTTWVETFRRWQRDGV